MSHTSGSTSSPIPISPFSPSPFSANSDSHYTSDDQPDLGAFRTVLREWVHLQPPPRIPVWAPSSTTNSQSQTQTRTGNDSETEGQRSTVWNQRPIADYLQVSLSSVSRVGDSDSDGESPDETDTDTEGARTVEIETEDGGGSYTTSPLQTQPSLDDDSQSLPLDGIDEHDEHDIAVDDRSVSIASTLSSLPLQLRRLSLTPPLPDGFEFGRPEGSFYESARSSSSLQSQPLAEVQSTSSLEDVHTPSLGYLDEALSFIAAERARWTAQREAGEWQHVIEPSSADGEHRRKRRKKRIPLLDPSVSISSDETLSIGRPAASISIASDNYSDDEEEGWPRPTRGLSKSTPTTPRPRSRVRPVRPTIITATATPVSTPYPYNPPSPHENTTTTTSPKKSKTKKTKKLKLRSKPAPEPPQIQILTHSRSTPTLRNFATREETSADAATDPPRPRLRLRSRSKPPPGTLLPSLFLDVETTAASSAGGGDTTERGRLMRLAHELEVLFPEEREVLRGVEGRLAGVEADKRREVDTGDCEVVSTGGAGDKENKRKRGRREDDGAEAGGGEKDGAGGSRVPVDSHGHLDPRGREVRDGDALVHVFIDHSNILIGLLNHLRRHPPSKVSSAQVNASSTRHRKTLSNPPPTHIGGPTEGGKDIETLIQGRKPKPPKPKPPNAEEDATGQVMEAGRGKSKDTQEEALGEVRSGDRGTRMRSINTERVDGLGERDREFSTGKGRGKASRPLPPIPVPASTTTASTVALDLSSPIAASSHTTPIPLPSFATAGKSISKAGGNNDLASPTTTGLAASSSVAFKIFGIPGASSTSVPASTAHPSMAPATHTSTVSSTSLSHNISINSTTDTANTTPPSSPRKLGQSQNTKSNIKSTATALSIPKRLSKSAHTLSMGDSEAKEVGGGGVESSEESPREANDPTKKRPGRHLSHTALALILERGRPITRRVLVTSSPLYQPMDTMERLGYEVRVYIRVPDLGDGMDRERHRNSSGYGHGRRHSGGGSGSATLSTPSSPKKKAKDHARRISGTTSAENTGASTSTSAGEPRQTSVKGSAPPTAFSFPHSDLSPTTAPTASDQHHHYHAYERHALGLPLHTLFPHHQHTQHHHQPLRPPIRIGGSGAGVGAGGSAPPRIRYREQGVDELLQLKLHQALAAVDDVPDGATIVLATGDGNVGQFNEDGFLGPVRTALKRGWKVELYAWEDGLSRSWKREFGEGSEWGQSGMFNIIGMEQFAQSLVEEGF